MTAFKPAFFSRTPARELAWQTERLRYGRRATLYLRCLLTGLILGAIEFFALGAVAAIWMGSIYGSNSGGTEMSSFFTFGPLAWACSLLLRSPCPTDCK